MAVCHYFRCTFNQKHRCTASEELNLDESARCLAAAQNDQDDIETILEFLERFSVYPFDENKDREFFREILDDFTGLDVLEQLKSFQAWILDQAEDMSIRFRSTIRKWMRRSYERKKRSSGEKAESDRLVGIK
jgi:hypothetical protein